MQTPQPTKKKPQFSTEGSIIGLETETRELVRIPQAARRQGMYVIGKNGTGKTTFLSQFDAARYP